MILQNEPSDTLLDTNSNKYSKEVHERFQSKKNMGSLDETKKNVGVGLVGAPACGDLIKLQIEVNNNKIIDAKAKVFGCKSAIASASLAIDKIIGQSLQQAEQLKNTELSQELALPPIKLHCSALAEEGIKEAIQNYKNKNNTG